MAQVNKQQGNDVPLLIVSIKARLLRRRSTLQNPECKAKLATDHLREPSGLYYTDTAKPL